MTATVQPSTDAWAAYAAGSDVEHFSEACLVLLEQSVDDWAGEPLGLEPWQLAHVGEALSYGPDGAPYWASVVLVVPRKNGKTTRAGRLRPVPPDVRHRPARDSAGRQLRPPGRAAV
jgi:hypothetical protein